MDDTANTPAKKAATKKSTLAATATMVTKNIIGAVLNRPATVELPQAVAEIHVSPEDVIPAGTIITDEIAIEAGLDEDDLAALESAGHVKFVEVYAMAVAGDEA
jgi:hypothetical protein